MTAQHNYLPISKIQEGMVLATDLLDKQGQVLLPAGITITQKMLSSFAMHDVHQLCILMSEINPPPLSDAALEKKSQNLEILFRHAHFEEPRNTLVNLVKKYRLGEMP